MVFVAGGAAHGGPGGPLRREGALAASDGLVQPAAHHPDVVERPAGWQHGGALSCGAPGDDRPS